MCDFKKGDVVEYSKRGKISTLYANSAEVRMNDGSSMHVGLQYLTLIERPKPTPKVGDTVSRVPVNPIYYKYKILAVSPNGDWFVSTTVNGKDITTVIENRTQKKFEVVP